MIFLTCASRDILITVMNSKLCQESFCICYFLYFVTWKVCYTSSITLNLQYTAILKAAIFENISWIHIYPWNWLALNAPQAVNQDYKRYNTQNLINQLNHNHHYLKTNNVKHQKYVCSLQVYRPDTAVQYTVRRTNTESFPPL